MTTDLYRSNNDVNFYYLGVMRHYLIYFLAAVAVSCSSREQSQESRQQPAPEAYRDKLASLPAEYASSKKGLELFRDVYKGDNKEKNDSLLNDYLTYQASLIDSLNEQLQYLPEFQTLDSLETTGASEEVYAGSIDRIDKKLSENALSLEFSEGMPYIGRNPDVIVSYFSGTLTEPTTAYFTQAGKETKEGFSEDAGITIPIHDLADRIGFWDNFMTKYPNHMMIDDVKARRKNYMFYILQGMENTPAFDFDKNTLIDEYREAYQYYVKTYPDTPAAKTLNEYLQTLEKSEYKRDEAVVAFIEKHQPF